MTTELNLFATTPKGLELLLVDELKTLGATHAAEKLAGVEFTGDLELAYKSCLWSRLANRILLRLTNFPAATPEELYKGIQTIQWDQHMNPEDSLSVNFISSQSEINHTLFGAQKVKDAIVDQFREKFNTRPNVAKEHPDLSVNVYLYRNVASVSIDLSGDSLHKRNYRLGGGGIAPLKENLAAAILIRAGWLEISNRGGSLIDPMSGSGTLLIEAAMIAGNIAPGLARDYFGFLKWKQHQSSLWEKLVDEATTKKLNGLSKIPTIIGYDADPYATKIAFENITRAGLLGKIHVEKRDLSAFDIKETIEPGLIISNPPYGERIGEEAELERLYSLLGEKLKALFNSKIQRSFANAQDDKETACHPAQANKNLVRHHAQDDKRAACHPEADSSPKDLNMNWHAAIFTGNPELAKRMGIRARKYYSLVNGAIPCQLLLFDLSPNNFFDRSPASQNERRINAAKRAMENQDNSSVDMFINRLRKNLKHLKKWQERENISCYRVYDADLPEYAFTVDIYGEYIYVQEYPPPKTVDFEKAKKRQQEVLARLPEALDIQASKIFFRVRPWREVLPPENLFHEENFYLVDEFSAKYFVNLNESSVDTGLPLEQRKLRKLIRETIDGGHFLNVFSQSGDLTIAAALGGAATTKTIVESGFYFKWTKQNFIKNQLAEKKNQVVTTDPLLWFSREKTRFHCIVANLPFLEDYEEILYKLLRLLLPDGVLYVLSKDRQFKIQQEWCSDFSVLDISHQITPEDIARSKLRAWKIS